MVHKDIYEDVLRELEKFYAPVANRTTFYLALKSLFTEDDMMLWLRFPTHAEEPVTLDEMEHDDLYDKCLQHLFDQAFIIEWIGSDGKIGYVRSYIFQIMLSHSIDPEDSLIQAATRDWFNGVVDGMSGFFNLETTEYRTIPHEGALTGDPEYGEYTMDLEIPDTREVVTYDYVSKMVRSQDLIIVGPCFCRSNREFLGIRECDHPIETCILFGNMAARNLKYGWGRRITADEALAIVKDARERGLVQNISNSEEPSILCNCCRCCCLPLNTMARHERSAGKPSRYIASQKLERCTGCGDCAAVCPMGAYEIINGKAVFDDDKCIGCGLCVDRCKKSALHLVLRDPKGEDLMPERKTMDVMFL